MSRLPKTAFAAAAAAAAGASLAACSTPGIPQRAVLGSTLTGYQAVPGPGDLDGTGTARLRVDSEAARICWEVNARGIDPATAAHVHRGAAGSAGPPVVPLSIPDSTGRSEGCSAVAGALAAEMIAQPHLFYVNVHNAAFPASAIRGQLRGLARRPESRAAPPVRR
ncbi:CHRD domain-containing protein [Allosphingosinicella sp.]|jgi:hypothetical protein|uniref:CHRD domain-containing protein n=1 Tax=Allosphingosinicella sp. TaxID=2823234 RepID=UPI002EF850F6